MNRDPESTGVRALASDELWEDGAAIDAALRRAVREALLRHKKLGNPIVVARDGKAVWIPAEEIEVEELPEEGEG